MLQEAHQLLAAGRDVVVATASHKGRRQTRELLAGLEVIPAAAAGAGVGQRETDLGEMDLDAVLARHPEVAIVDEYGHNNEPGSRNQKRWQDVEELLAAGIDVLSTVDIRQLTSLGDVVSAITGISQPETVADDVVRRADQIELVDVSPELLRQRLSEGNLYPPDTIDTALAGEFRLGNLSALREIALIWLADRVDEGLTKYREVEGIRISWPARERVVVGLSGGPEGEVLIRRASRILSRVSGGDLLAVHARRADGAATESLQDLEIQHRLVTELGGSYHTVAVDDPADGLLEFARDVNATQIVVGVSRGFKSFLGGGVGAKVVRDSGDIDVHMVSHPWAPRRSLPRRVPGLLGRARTGVGFALAVLLPVTATALMSLGPELNLATHVLVHLTGVIAVAFIGGLWPAVLAAILDSLLINYFETGPVGTLSIDDPQNLFALVVFLGVAVAVSMVVGISAKRSRETTLARAEAATLADLARGALLADDTVGAFLEKVRETFRVRSAGLFTRETAAGRQEWELKAYAGDAPPFPPGTPESSADTTELADPLTAVVVSGRTLTAGERRLLTAHGAHLLLLQQRQALKLSLEQTTKLAEGNKIRTAILRAVSHDLRTPLAGIKLAVTALQRRHVRLPEEVQAEMLQTIDSYADRLEALISNLLDMSRISSDAIAPHTAPVIWRDAIEDSLRGVSGGRLRVELAPNMPAVDADLGMLERVIANIVENALKYAPDSDVVILGPGSASVVGTVDGRPCGELRIVDHGQGVPAKEVIAMFQPFQRLDDAPEGLGIGLGLAVAKGFTETMGGTLTAEPTPGGGLTMIIRLPLSAGAGVSAEPGKMGSITGHESTGAS
jgi:two-component system sensor histidine kinase KdpD